MSLTTRCKNFFYQKLFEPILKSKDSPQFVALGAAIGMFIALTPTVGIQMTLVLFVAFIPGLHFNIPVAMAMVWLSNPFTMWFLYYAFYKIGLFCMGRVGDDWNQFRIKVDEILTQIENLPWLEKLYEGVHGFFLLGLNYAIPMWIGSLLVATILGGLTYPLTLKILKKSSSSLPPPSSS